jgi:predicted enzyme related to lactoylglutathione lyase
MRVRGYVLGAPCWVEVSSPDPVAAQAFYTRLFGWSTARSPAGRPVFLLDGGAVAGVQQGAPAQWLTWFYTFDIEATARDVEAAGGAVLDGPVAAGDDGIGAVFADPAGAVFAAWQQYKFVGAGVANQPGAMCWTELSTPDTEGAGRFYSRVFRWSDRPHEWPADERSVGGIGLAEDDWPSDAAWRVCFLVADCHAAVDAATALGGRVEAGPAAGAGGTVARLADPAGARLTVVEPPPEVLAALL